MVHTKRHSPRTEVGDILTCQGHGDRKNRQGSKEGLTESTPGSWTPGEGGQSGGETDPSAESDKPSLFEF